ncbi:Senecionine N-oxygenase [Madurella fahalii]|uniref:glutaminase n=1 Tax=Madurella fahalii TaxID=1157608 RepID=A0ABQ0GPM7_9PEZI
MPISVGVLALQGGVIEHLNLLRKAADHILSSSSSPQPELQFTFHEVRTAPRLAQCDALIIPGGESTTMAIVARRLGLLDPLREFVKSQHKPVWGTCAGLVMLAEQASATKQGGQELIGGLDVRVLRNRYGSQVQSFVADLDLPFLGGGPGGERERPFRGVFIRAPVVEEVIAPAADAAAAGGDGKGRRGPVEVLGVYRSGEKKDGEGDIVAVRQGNVFGTSFHPELTEDVRIHVWWLRQVLEAVRHGDLAVGRGI